jgi:predicted KAP-like P-loop ATPase
MTKSSKNLEKEALVSSERPIEKLVDDELGRVDFAVAVAKVISQWGGRDSLVLAIYGPWGSGKSSLKNMILDALTKEDSKTISMEFNPWEWAGQDRVFEGFFAELSSRLGSTDASKKALDTAKKIKMYGAMLSAASSITGVVRWVLIGFLFVVGFFGIAPLFGVPHLTSTLEILGALALVAALVLAGLGRTTDELASYLAAKGEATRKSVSEVKKELQILLGTLKKNVLIVVDDVDRLTPTGIRMVFQLVKANADFPNLVYLLLLQRDTVEKALAGQGEAEVDGAQFLDKVVQVAFDVPKLSPRKLEETLESTVSRIVQGTPAEDQFDSERWSKLFFSAIRPYFRTLRDVKRFSNTLSFHFELYRDLSTFDANPIDLIALEVLRQFEGAVYQKLHGAKELLTGTSHYALGQWLSPDAKKAAEALLALADRPVEAQNILVNVFPPFAWAMVDKNANRIGHRGEFQNEWLKGLRACDPDIFERYFSFSLSEDDLSESELSSLLAIVGDRQGFVQKLRQLSEKQLLSAAIVRIALQSSRISSEHTLPFVIGIFDIERELFTSRPAAGVAKVPISTQAVLIIRSVLRQRSTDAVRLLHQAIEQTTALYLPMISFESSDKERKEAIDPLVSEQEAKSLQDLCIEKIRAVRLRPELLSNPWLRYILAFWAKWASEEEVSAWLSIISESDSGLASLLTVFVEQMNTIGEGGRTTDVQFRFALEDFSRYLKPEVLADRIQQLKPSEQAQQLACRLFLYAFDRQKASGRVSYPRELSGWTTLDRL